MLLANRLRIEDTHRRHPAIGDEVSRGPLFIIGLPRTGTTALSQLLSLDPQIRSLRLWESSDPVPPPEAATEDTDPRIADAEAGPRGHVRRPSPGCVAALPDGHRPHRVPGPAGHGVPHRPLRRHGPRPRATPRWALDCDMAPAYRYHRRVLQLLQWHCPPRLWHLKTPVHMLALDALDAAYPERPLPVDPPRSGAGPRVGVQPGGLRPQLGERPRRRRRARRPADGAVERGAAPGHGLPPAGGREPLRRHRLRSL